MFAHEEHTQAGMYKHDSTSSQMDTRAASLEVAEICRTFSDAEWRLSDSSFQAAADNELSPVRSMSEQYATMRRM